MFLSNNTHANTMVENIHSNAHLTTIASAEGRFKLLNAEYTMTVSPNGKIALLTDVTSAVDGSPSLETLAGDHIHAVNGKYEGRSIKLIEQTENSFKVNVLCKDDRIVTTYLRNKSVGYNRGAPLRRSARLNNGNKTYVEPLPTIMISWFNVEDVFAVSRNQDDHPAAAQSEPVLVEQTAEHTVETTPVDSEELQDTDPTVDEEHVYLDNLEYAVGGELDLSLETVDGKATEEATKRAAEGATEEVTEEITEDMNEKVDKGAAEGDTEEAAEQVVLEVEGDLAKPIVQGLEPPSRSRTRATLTVLSVHHQVTQQPEALVTKPSLLVGGGDSTLVREVFGPQEQPLVEAVDPKAPLVQHEIELQPKAPVAEPAEAQAASSGKLDIRPSPAFISGKKQRQEYNTKVLRKNLGGDFTRIRALTAAVRKEKRKKSRIFPRPAFRWEWDEIRRHYVERSE